MQVFDFQIPDKELSSALERIYQTELAVLQCEFEIHCEEPRRRLALATVNVQTHGGVRSLGILIKESSKYELTVLSLMNKLLPYSSPRVICHLETPETLWLLLENITTWVDIGGRHRVNETLVDGLYVMQAMFFDNTQPLLSSFRAFPVITRERLLKTGTVALEDIRVICKNELFAELFEECKWGELSATVSEWMGDAEEYTFPTTLVHNHYNPNTTRAIRDPQGRVHVVVYDWQNAAIGWPQIDLALLLDRLDMIASGQGLAVPSPVLLQQYVSRLDDEYDIDTELFYKVYNICYVCRMLPLMRWWMQGHMRSPAHDPARVFLEIRTKLDMISELREGRDKS